MKQVDISQRHCHLISLSLFRPTSLSKPPLFSRWATQGRFTQEASHVYYTSCCRLRLFLHMQCRVPSSPFTPLKTPLIGYCGESSAPQNSPVSLRYLYPAFSALIAFSSNSPRKRTFLPHSPLITVSGTNLPFSNPTRFK
jgi:hypothetical protein